MLELEYSQVRDGNEVLRHPETPRGTLGVLQQAIYRLHISIAAPVQHATQMGRSGAVPVDVPVAELGLAVGAGVDVKGRQRIGAGGDEEAVRPAT